MMMAEEKTTGLQPRGRYFEEFEVGDEVISYGRTVTEADIVAFAALTGDYRSPKLTLGRTSKLDKGSSYGG